MTSKFGSLVLNSLWNSNHLHQNVHQYQTYHPKLDSWFLPPVLLLSQSLNLIPVYGLWKSVNSICESYWVAWAQSTSLFILLCPSLPTSNPESCRCTINTPCIPLFSIFAIPSYLFSWLLQKPSNWSPSSQSYPSPIHSPQSNHSELLKL